MFPPNFGRKGVTRAAGADRRSVLFSAEGIASLDQVVRKYPVNRCFLIKAILHQLFEISGGLRRVGIIKTDRETALLPIFAFSPLNIENGDRIGQTGRLLKRAGSPTGLRIFFILNLMEGCGLRWGQSKYCSAELARLILEHQSLVCTYPRAMARSSESAPANAGDESDLLLRLQVGKQCVSDPSAIPAAGIKPHKCRLT